MKKSFIIAIYIILLCFVCMGATNTSGLNTDEIVTDKDAAILSASVENGMLIADIYVKDELRESTRVYVAGYSNDGHVLFVKDVSIEKPVTELKPADYYKLFIWNSCKPVCDSFTIKHTVKYKPTIIFQFDNGNDDNRMDILDEYGFNGCATFSYPMYNGIFQKGVKIAERGYDCYAIYGGKSAGAYGTVEDGEGNIIYPITLSPEEAVKLSVEQWYIWVGNLVSIAEENGITRPLTYLCNKTNMYENLLEACKMHGFKYFRYNTLYKNNGKIVYVRSKLQNYTTDTFGTLAMNGNDTDISALKAAIEERISNNATILLFTHNVSDNPTNLDTGTERFKAILAYIRQLKDEGVVDVMSLRSYYRKYHLAEGASDDLIRDAALAEYKRK